MNDFQRHTTAAYGSDQVVDAGLQGFMRGVYNTMGFGLALTGAVAFAVANFPPLFNAIFGTPLAFVAMVGPLAFLWFGLSPARIARMEIGKARTMFYVFCTLVGLSMAIVFKVYTGDSIARVFFITAATFAATSLWGYTTKKDLTTIGSFAMMGVWGVIIAMIVNIFLKSPVVMFAYSVIGVIAFTLLAAWQTQALKETYRYGGVGNDKLALNGALSLYLCVLNIFSFLLNLMGNRE